MRKGGAQRSARDLNQSRVGPVHLQDQEDRARNRQRGGEQAAHHGRIERAKRPKLMKMIVSQRTSMTRSGRETERVSCSYISQRVFRRSIAILSAWLWSERCASSFGERPWILA